jgi:hypothetical protein
LRLLRAHKMSTECRWPHGLGDQHSLDCRTPRNAR